MKKIIFTGLLASLTFFCQTQELRKIDNELTGIYRTMVNADYQLRFDSIAPRFKKQLLEQLSNPVTFDNSLDSLSKYVTIKTSPDKKIKFYSWDDLSGGTWHHINCVAQFETDNEKIIVRQINSGKEAELGEYTDSWIYEIFELNTGKEKLYLTIARGTHGSGNHHQTVQIFSIRGEDLVKCNSCFTDNKDFVIEYPRSEKANLTFDPTDNKLRFNEVKFDEKTGFYKPTGKIISLEFINGVFMKN